MADWISIASVTELGPGQACLVQAGPIEIAIINLRGEYHALENRCSHQGVPLLGHGLPLAEVLHGEQLVCLRHGARFCVRSGAALTPPAPAPLKRFPVRKQGTDVQLYLDRPTAQPAK